MATLENRITLLEQKTSRNLDVRDMTDGELLDFIGLPDGATDKQLHVIINEGTRHGE